jgi:hypothetical protein
MASKYDVSAATAFTVLDREQPCTRCGKVTLTVFRGGVCSDCTSFTILSSQVPVPPVLDK